jgi:hypothetical protein
MAWSSWKTIQQFLKLLNKELSYDPSILLLDIYQSEMKTNLYKKKNLVQKCSLQHYSQQPPNGTTEKSIN